MSGLIIFLKQVIGLSVLNRFNFPKTVLAIIFWKFLYNKEFTFNFNFEGRGFRIFADNRMDLVAVYETFVLREYESEFKLKDNSVIVDLGANIGDTSIFFSLKFPNSSILSVEPNPRLLKKLIKNTTPFKNIKVINCAISEKTSLDKLTVGESHLGGSLLKRSQNNEYIEIQGYSFLDFCKNEGIKKIDLLKFDIEGAEVYLIKDKNILEQRVEYIAGEIHNDLVDGLDQYLDKLELKDIQKNYISKNRYIIFGHF